MVSFVIPVKNDADHPARKIEVMLLLPGVFGHLRDHTSLARVLGVLPAAPDGPTIRNVSRPERVTLGVAMSMAATRVIWVRQVLAVDGERLQGLLGGLV